MRKQIFNAYDDLTCIRIIKMGPNTAPTTCLIHIFNNQIKMKEKSLEANEKKQKIYYCEHTFFTRKTYRADTCHLIIIIINSERK